MTDIIRLHALLLDEDVRVECNGDNTFFVRDDMCVYQMDVYSVFYDQSQTYRTQQSFANGIRFMSWYAWRYNLKFREGLL